MISNTHCIITNILKTYNKRFVSLKLTIAVALLAFPSLSFAQEVKTNEANTDNSRSEVKYKQRHSNLIADEKDIYADGIKIKRDLSIIQELQEERILSEDEIPADDLYGGLWDNNYVHRYAGKIKNMPDSFMVNLENFTMPIKEGRVTSKFGPRRRRMHNGVDLKVQIGDTIYAAFDGKVRMISYERRGYGKYVVIRHPNGLETVYGHLSGYLVEEDDVVKSGDPIALGGNTGRSTGSHLHFEFRFLGQAINPAEIVDFENFVCHRDQYLVTTHKYKAKNSNAYTNGKLRYHRIKKGDTLSHIAVKYGTTVSALVKKNNLNPKKNLRIGTSIRI